MNNTHQNQTKTDRCGSLPLAPGSVAARLTPEQIKNWRHILCGMIGPYALIMPDDDVQMYRDRMQAAMSKPQNTADQRRSPE